MPNDVSKTEVAERPKLAPVIDTGEFAELLDSDRFAQIQRVAKLFSESDLIPEAFQGKPANCAVALQMAFRMRVDPMLLMQSMYVVYGRPGIEAKLAIALINQRGPFTGPLQWDERGEGDSRSWTCYATHRATGEKCSMTVTWAMVKAEGWADKKGSKWLTIPQLMGRYRSAAWLGRVYCPEVILGLPFDDELRDEPREHIVPGTRVDEIIPMPKARAASDTNQAGMPAEPYVDTATGEIEQPKPTMGGPDPAPLKSDAEAVGAKEGADLVDAAIAGDPMAMKRLATKAQREMVLAVASKHKNLTPEQLDVFLSDKFAITVATLPMALVNDVLKFVSEMRSA